MKSIPWIISLVVGILVAPVATATAIEKAVEGSHRTPAFVERDRYRHPAETLSFFNVQPHHIVVEIWPGPNGWYTEILAPLLKEEGQLYTAQFPKNSGIPFYEQSVERFKEKLASNPDIYSTVTITHIPGQPAPDNSADRVLTFRNVHNWHKAGTAETVFQQMFTALKPGGILGVVEHRAPPGTSLDEMATSGYMTETYVIKLATQAGFELVDKSEINANPKDSADHPKGVWTLPPSLRLGEEKRDHYLAIGESDRMTLKFIKPEL